MEVDTRPPESKMSTTQEMQRKEEQEKKESLLSSIPQQATFALYRVEQTSMIFRSSDLTY